MKWILFCLVLFSGTAFAETVPNPNQDSFNWFVGLYNDIYEVVEHTPTFIEQAFAYVIEFSVYIKFYLMMQTLEFAYGVAQSLIVNIGLDSLITDAVSKLPAETRSTFQAMGYLKGITIICEAYAVRFVLNFMGW